MKIGDYVRTKNGYIGKIYNINEFREPSMMYVIDIPKADDFIFMGEKDFKSSPNIIDLIEPQDLMYIDIDNDYDGGIVVPRVAETMGELEEYIDNFKNKETTLVGIVTHEQLHSCMYKVVEENESR